MSRRALLLALFLSGVGVASALGQAYTVVHSFAQGGGGPYGGLTKGPGGKLYGASTGGGFWGYGSVFVLTPDGGGGFTYTTLYSFTGGDDGALPEAALILASDGNFYGTTFSGFSAPGGTVFRVDAAGNLETLHQFFGIAGEGYNLTASLVQGSDGNLYAITYTGGIGYGTVFQISLAGDFATLHAFEGGGAGAHPFGALVEGSDGNLYGTTGDGGAQGGLGTIFRISFAGDFATIHNFTGADGANPAAGMVIGPDGFFYGTTTFAGDNNEGTVFRSDLDGNVTAFSFSGIQFGQGAIAPLVVADDDNLYGTTYSTVYRFATSGTITTLHTFTGPDGDDLMAPLIQADDGKLYGTTVLGVLGRGSIFRLSTSGSAFETVHAYSGGPAANPSGALFTGAGNRIFGTAGGGTYSFGTVFALDPDGHETDLHSFDGTSGSFPADLVISPSGDLFGVTNGGGGEDLGTVFEISSAGVFGLLHSFVSEEGSVPTGLTLSADGSLVGATDGASVPPLPSTLFRIDSMGTFSTLHVFSGPDGQFPGGDFLETDPGTFLGVAQAGGADDLGVVYRFDTSGAFTLVHSFEGWDGTYPIGLTKGPDGLYYGLARQGGAFGGGTIFRIDALGHVVLLHSFGGADGQDPDGALVLGDDGNFYGATQFGGAFEGGVVFRSDGAGNVTVLHEFDGPEGREPLSQIYQGTDTGIYGATRSGGLFGGGVVFRIDLPASLSVWGIDPSSGPAAGGTDVTITGFHFDAFPTVAIGGVPATNVEVQTTNALTGTTPALAPGTLNDVTVTDFATQATATLKNGWLADFLDVPAADPFHDDIAKILRRGITAGIGNGNYGIGDSVTRAQMAVFLLKGEHGEGYAPPPCTGLFVDVECQPTPAFAVDWIEQLSREQITAGCSDAVHYCPDAPISRAQMAVLLLKAKNGSSFAPPDCAGIFVDVPCPPTTDFPYSDWVEELFNEHITGGCGDSSHYCPDDPATRGQMAVFLVLTFQLP